MKYNKIKEGIFNSLMYMGEVQYPIGRGYDVRFHDYNEWGDENIENYGIQLLKNGVVVGDYKIGSYSGGTIGNILYFGRNIINDMATAVMGSVVGTKEEVVLNYLPF